MNYDYDRGIYMYIYLISKIKYLLLNFGCPKITFDGISRHFRSIRNLNLLLIFHKLFWMPFQMPPAIFKMADFVHQI